MHELSITRHIAAPPEKVWQVMTERMEEWWCPRPWTTKVERFDHFPGGASAFVLRGPDGEENSHGGYMLAWDEGRRFAFTDAIDAELRPSGPFMVGIWEVAPEDEGTRYTATARHWTAEAMAHHQEMGFDDGWGACADQLQALCEEG